MARKRSIRIEEESVGSESDDSGYDKERMDESKDVGWSTWAQRTYARYWYVVGCAFFDLIIGLETARITPSQYSTTVPVILFFALVLTEWYLYAKIWKRSRSPNE